MKGIELILSAVCNITMCEPQHAPEHPVVNVRLQRELEYKAARETVNGKHLQIGTYNKIDLTAAFISVTPELLNSITFDLETDTFNCLFTKDSRARSLVDPGNILQPFQATVWICFVLVLVLYVTCVVLLTRLRAKLLGDDEEPFTVSSSISYVYRVCTQQDVPQAPKASMTRILLMTWSIFVILTSTYYAANLSKSFTITSVVERDDVEVWMKWLEENDVTLDVTDVAGCFEVLSLNNFIRRPRAFAYQKNTTLKNLFSREIKRLYYAGLLEKFYRTSEKFKRSMCPAVVSSAMQQLGLRDLKVCYYCWLVGITAGLGAFAVELLVGWVKISKVAPVAEIHLQPMDTSRCVVSEDEDCGLSSNQSSPSFQRKTVNGRRYLVAKTRQGEPRLVPEDTLSYLSFTV